MSQATFVPQILEKSRKIVHQKRDSNIPIHQRLYQQDTNKKEIFLSKVQLEEDKENTFVPNIQEKSK